jgi:hypothetical protein
MNEAAEEKSHLVDGLPEEYTVSERQTFEGPRFFPRRNGETFVQADGRETSYATLVAASESLHEYVKGIR